MYQRTVLDNGLPVLTSTMPNIHSVSMALFVGAGSRYETDDMAGASHFLEHLLFKGTKGWPTAREVSEAIEGVGGIMNASTDREMTIYWCKVAKPHFRTALAVLADMLVHPIIDPEELEKEREVILEELRMTNDYPSNRVGLLIDETLWPAQPMGRDVGGSQESVKAITRDHVMEYMGSQYTPRNVVAAVAGDVSHDEVVDLLQDLLKDWKDAEPIPWFPVEEHNGSAPVRVEQRSTDQAHLCLALPGLHQDHPDRYAMTLMNVMLGEGMSSRLFLELREKQSLAYDVHSSISFYRDCGSMSIYCGVEPKKSHGAVSAILEQLKGLQDSIPQSELDKSRELSKGRMMLRMEDSRSVAMWLGAQEKLAGRVHTVDEVVALLDEVTTEDVERVAADLVRDENLKLAVVGPHRSDRPFQKLLKL